jgi:hypothetical protein
MAIRTWALWVACLLAGTSIAAGQNVVSSFQDLARLVKTGDTVTVSDSTGTSITGTITELTGTSLVLRGGAEQRHFAEADVTRIQQRRQDSLLNGALIGAGIGAAFAALGASSCANDLGCTDSAGAFFALGLAVGTGAGIGVDAAIIRERIIFDRLGRHGVALSLAPAVSRGRAGAALSVRF